MIISMYSNGNFYVELFTCFHIETFMTLGLHYISYEANTPIKEIFSMCMNSLWSTFINYSVIYLVFSWIGFTFLEA